MSPAPWWPSAGKLPGTSAVAAWVGSRDDRRRHDGQDRLALQAARVRVPVVRDLRRPRLVLRLRPLRRPAQGQHQAALAVGDGAGAGRHRRARLVDHPPPAGLGGIRPRRRLHRPARRLQVLQEALPRRPSRGRAVRPAPEQAARARRPTATSPRRATSTSCSRRASARWRRPASPSTSARRRPRASSSTSRTSPRSRAASRRSASPRSASRSATRSRPGNFIFRTLEFEQMEMEFFVPPAEADEWYRYWVDERYAWHRRYGIRESHLRIRPHDADELSHYSSGTSDIEYLFPIGWSELEGVANRGDFDLTAHTNASGTKLEWVEQDGTPLHAARDRAGARRQPLDARLPRRRLRRGGRRRPRAHRAAPASAARAREGGGAAADRQERGHDRPGAQALRGAARR